MQGNGQCVPTRVGLQYYFDSLIIHASGDEAAEALTSPRVV